MRIDGPTRTGSLIKTVLLCKAFMAETKGSCQSFEATSSRTPRQKAPSTHQLPRLPRWANGPCPPILGQIT